MTALLLVASLALGTPKAPATLTPSARASAQVPRGSARALAAVSFAVLVGAGGLLHRKLGVRADAEEAEALIDAAFARLERSDAEARTDGSSMP